MNDPVLTGRVNYPLPEDVLKFFQAALSVILGLGALLTAGGFIIVNTHLARYTNMAGINLAPAQYLVAGVGFWVLAAILMALIWIFGVPVVVRKLENRIQELDTIRADALASQHSETKKQTILREADRLEKSFIRNERILIAGYVALAILGAGIIYWTFIYGNIPQGWGGGKPTVVTLVLKDDLPVMSLGLAPDAAEPRRTTPLELLAYLTDGLLVRDVVTGSVIHIHNDVIAAAIDESSSQTNESTLPVTPAPTPTT